MKNILKEKKLLNIKAQWKMKNKIKMCKKMRKISKKIIKMKNKKRMKIL